MTDPRAPKTLARPLLWTCALAVGATLAGAAPQAPVSSTGDTPTAFQEAPQNAGDLEKSLNRIVYLTDGRALRARARWLGDRWEVRSGSGWQALSPHLVDRVRLERDVLKESKELARGVKSEDHARRVALADWMLRAGLVVEGLRELDRVLEAEPDQADAVGLLNEPPVPLKISLIASDEPEALLREAAGAPPAVRELAVAKLPTLEDEEALRTRLAAVLHSHSPRLRTLAALALRRLYPGAQVRSLASRSILDGSEAVRREAALSLKAVGNEAVILPAVRALESESASVRKNAIAALGTMEYAAAVEPLITHLSSMTRPQSGGDARPPRAHIFVGRQFAYIQDFDVEVAQGAAIADPQVNALTEGSVLDVRVIGTNVVSTAVESRGVRRSLALLTGEERSSKGWIQWWKENKDKFVPATPPLTPTGPSSTGG